MQRHISLWALKKCTIKILLKFNYNLVGFGGCGGVVGESVNFSGHDWSFFFCINE